VVLVVLVVVVTLGAAEAGWPKERVVRLERVRRESKKDKAEFF